MRAALRTQVSKRVETYQQILNGVSLLQSVSADDKKQLADALVETTFFKGELIIEEGDEIGRTFYILDQGELEVIVKGKVVTTYVASRGTTPHFGEKALFNDEPRAATIRVKTDRARCLVLDRDIFTKIVQPKVDDRTKGYVKYEYANLKHVGLLGCGGFGKVTLVLDKGTNLHFALKQLSKGHLLKEKQANGVMNEKKILRMTHCPFLVQVAATFNLKNHLCFLLEPAMGGELFTIYIKRKFYGKENLAMFYAACVTKGLEHLHERCIIYRDMKPENLLLDIKGYCKIADFGLAKFVIGKTFTTCGTPDYFAPELLKGNGHTSALDWWTLGILIYEFMTGQTPFSSDDLSLMFSKMSRGIEKSPAFRDGGQSNWKDLVSGLCKLEPSERLAVRPGGSTNVCTHKWYKDSKFSWPDLTKRTMKAPWDPNVSVNNLRNFDAQESDAPPEIAYRDPGNGWDAEFADAWGPRAFD
jgi:cGMP-dependent protein kinase